MATTWWRRGLGSLGPSLLRDWGVPGWEDPEAAGSTGLRGRARGERQI